MVVAAVLPTSAVGAEAYDDELPAPLHPQEELLVARAVERRRKEFATARRCAREALATLGAPSGALLAGERREPLWPAGVVGSITHCVGYRAAAVARSGDLASLGLDAEPNAPLPDKVLESVSLPVEREHLAELAASRGAGAGDGLAGGVAGADGMAGAGTSGDVAEVHWDRLLFSAKESVYKAWFPLARRWLGFGDAALTIDPAAGTFTARLLVAGPLPDEGPGHELVGRFRVSGDLLVTAVAVPRAPTPPEPR